MEIEDMSFEEAFGGLEGMVSRLEEGGLTLAENLAFFERGAQLAAHCGKLLDQAELKVRKLLPLLEGGYGARPAEKGPGGEFLL